MYILLHIGNLNHVGFNICWNPRLQYAQLPMYLGNLRHVIFNYMLESKTKKYDVNRIPIQSFVMSSRRDNSREIGTKEGIYYFIFSCKS